jgi:hypothetical protein
MADPPSFIALPPREPPRRSALKHPSRPGTPTTSPPPGSGPTSPFASAASGALSPPSLLSPLPPAMLGSPPHAPAPPLPAAGGFAAKVSFDTFENPAASMFSYTLRARAGGYARARDTRVFLCASSPDASGARALEWALDALAQDGDELVVFRGVPEDVLGACGARARTRGRR